MLRYVLPPDPADEEDSTPDERNESKKRKRGQNANRQRPNFRESLILCPRHRQEHSLFIWRYVDPHRYVG